MKDTLRQLKRIYLCMALIPEHCGQSCLPFLQKLSDCLSLSLRIPQTPFNSILLFHTTGKVLRSSQLNCPRWTKPLKPQAKKRKIPLYFNSKCLVPSCCVRYRSASTRMILDYSKLSEPPWVGRCLLIWCYLTDFIYALYKNPDKQTSQTHRSQSQSKSFPQTGRKTCFRTARANPSYLSQTSLWWQMLLLKDGKLI